MSMRNKLFLGVIFALLISQSVFAAYTGPWWWQLYDVPSMVGQAGKALGVNPTENGVTWITATGTSHFSALADVTATATGNAGKIVQVNASGTKYELVTVASAGTTINTTEVTVIASRSTSLTVNNTSYVSIPMTNVKDTYEEHSENGTFTAKIDQEILVTCQSEWNNVDVGGTFRGIFVVHLPLGGSFTGNDTLNGIPLSVYTVPRNTAMTGSRVFKVKAGDTLSFTARQDGTGSLSLNTCCIQITRLNTSVTDLASLGGADTLLIASQSTGVSCNNNIDTAIPMTADINQYGEWNPTTSVFTSRTNQRVSVNAGGYFALNSSTGYRTINVGQNGVASNRTRDLFADEFSPPAALGAAISASKIFTLNTGDTLTFNARQTSGGATSLTNSFIQIVRLNPPGTTYQTTAAKTIIEASGSAQSVSHAATATPTTKLTSIAETIDTLGEWDNNDDFTPTTTGYYRWSGIYDSANPITYSEARLWIYDSTANTYKYCGCLAQASTINTFSYPFTVLFYAVAGRTYSLYGGIMDGNSTARTITIRSMTIEKTIGW